MGRIGALVPEVLRTEAQFRLLFAGQVLSLVGDRRSTSRARRSRA
jgi:hypothetical protein